MKKKHAQPKPVTRWALYDSAGQLVTVERKRNAWEGRLFTLWHRVRVVPVSGRKPNGP